MKCKGKKIFDRATNKCVTHLPHIEIRGKRWFQRTYGNTYHTVEVSIDGKHLGKSDEQYGYGDQYIQTAFEMLQNNGYFKKTGERWASGASKDECEFYEDRREHRERYHISVSDVSRERDL